MTSPKDKKVIMLSDYKHQKKVDHYAKTHLDMRHAWEYASRLADSTQMKGLDPINVRLCLYKLLAMKLQQDGYDHHSLRRILLGVFDNKSK